MEKIKKIYATGLVMMILVVSFVGTALAQENEIDSDYSSFEDNNLNSDSMRIIQTNSMSSFKIIRAFTTLKGSNEVPKTKSRARGIADFLIDTDNNRLLFSIIYFGLEGNETGAHIHGPATRKTNAPVLFALPNTGGFKIGVWNYPENLESDILKGKMYVNIHSTKYPGGEIRGQIIKNRVFTFKSINPFFSGKNYNIEIKNFSFVPAELNVNEGDTITWTNLDNTSHTVTSDSGNELDSEVISSGASYSHVFNNNGNFSYHCTPHPNMHGKINVGNIY